MATSLILMIVINSLSIYPVVGRWSIMAMSGIWLTFFSWDFSDISRGLHPLDPSNDHSQGRNDNLTQ